MEERLNIQSALISVYDKTGIEEIARILSERNVLIYSTGGTSSFLRSHNIPVVDIEQVTAYPGILGGRVKTLHPKIFGGILNRRGFIEDMTDVAEYDIPNIDLVVVDLYPFQDTLNSGGSHEEIIEKIDIGGISLIRAAAKNYNHVVVVPSRKSYPELLEIVKRREAATTFEERKKFAAEAFAVSSAYDGFIYGYLAGSDAEHFRAAADGSMSLRYGENPHQTGTYFGNAEEMMTKLSGKELSYNNLLDVDAAVTLMAEFNDGNPTFAILKHNNACGVAVRQTVEMAYTDALAADPVSAFGGVLISNVMITMEAAVLMNDLFFEVLIAPAFQNGVVDFLTASKKNRICIHLKHFNLQDRQYRTILNGTLVQKRDAFTDSRNNLTVQTKISPTDSEIDDLLFAQKLVKNTRSNAIVLAKNGRLLASGTGQTSRVDALNQAIAKAKHFGFDLKGAVMASDAFFPFPDCVEMGWKEGVTAVIQPGGSVKDNLSISFCDEHNMSMVFTGIRHFKH
jgi:phosphoribosylaminoimidazolecarboxamide formyltransferase/IMP cyclohydrolase